MILSPGPVLEVDVHVLRAASPEPVIEATAAATRAAPTRDGGAGSTLDDSQRRHIARTLEQCNWVVEGPRGAAAVLGLHPNTLRSRMKKLGIRRTNESVLD